MIRNENWNLLLKFNWGTGKWAVIYLLKQEVLKISQVVCKKDVGPGKSYHEFVKDLSTESL